MTIRIEEIEKDDLDIYDDISPEFTVESKLEVELVDRGLGGMKIVEREIKDPYLKNYDEMKENGVEEWTEEFDTTNWGFFLIYQDDRAVGGMTMAYRSPDVNMLEGQEDMAVLWDMRIEPEERGQGLGSQLFYRAIEWCKNRGVRLMKIETQNINVRACSFYRGMGCELGEIDRYAYRGEERLEDEVMLIWYLKV